MQSFTMVTTSSLLLVFKMGNVIMLRSAKDIGIRKKKPKIHLKEGGMEGWKEGRQMNKISLSRTLKLHRW